MGMKIDGVFSGGGIKGLAFLGALEVLEERGLTLERVAGTSAGSLFAAFVAAGFTSEELKEEIMPLDFTSFLDNNKFPFPIKFINWLPIYWRLGLYKGDLLEQWVEKMLLKKGIHTFSDLPPGRLKMVASDLTNGRITVLPDDLHKYDIPFESFPIAKAVRMSCSIPYFFEPVRLKSQGKKSVIVDGGVLSNFPMWLFDDGQSRPQRPLLGFSLSQKSQNKPPKKIDNAFQLFEALFTTMMDAHDARYISKRHVKNIVFIHADKFQATDFGLDHEKKKALVERGRERTLEFLKGWSY